MSRPRPLYVERWMSLGYFAIITSLAICCVAAGGERPEGRGYAVTRALAVLAEEPTPHVGRKLPRGKGSTPHTTRWPGEGRPRLQTIVPVEPSVAIAKDGAS